MSLSAPRWLKSCLRQGQPAKQTGSHTHSHTHTHTHSHTHSHTLSLSHTHARTHTHNYCLSQAYEKSTAGCLYAHMWTYTAYIPSIWDSHSLSHYLSLSLPLVVFSLSVIIFFITTGSLINSSLCVSVFMWVEERERECMYLKVMIDRSCDRMEALYVLT